MSSTRVNGSAPDAPCSAASAPRPIPQLTTVEQPADARARVVLNVARDRVSSDFAARYRAKYHRGGDSDDTESNLESW